MSDQLPGAGVSPTLVGFGGNLLGKPMYINDDVLVGEANKVESIAGDLRSAVKTLGTVHDTVYRLPRNLPFPSGDPIGTVDTSMRLVVQALNLVAGLLDDEGTAIRDFSETMTLTEIVNLALFDPFALAVATSRGYGEQADDVIGETSSILTFKVSIGPQAKLKVPKINVSIGAATTVDVKVKEHITYYRDGTVEVTYSTGGGLGGEVGVGPKTEQPATMWGIGADVRIGVDGATTYRIDVDELEALRAWVQDGYSPDKLWRGDPPGAKISTTTAMSMSESFRAAIEKGGEHAIGGTIEGSIAETVMTANNGGLKKGDTVTTAAFTAASTAAVRERLGLPKLSVGGSATYAVSVVKDKHGNIKSIEISEAITAGGSGSGEFGDPSKKHGAVSAGADQTTITSHRVDVHDNPAMRDFINEAFAVAAVKNDGQPIPTALEIGEIVIKNGVTTSNAVETSTHAGGSVGAHLGLGFEVGIEGAGVEPVSAGEVESAIERDD